MVTVIEELLSVAIVLTPTLSQNESNRFVKMFFVELLQKDERVH